MHAPLELFPNLRGGLYSFLEETCWGELAKRSWKINGVRHLRHCTPADVIVLPQSRFA